MSDYNIYTQTHEEVTRPLTLDELEELLNEPIPSTLPLQCTDAAFIEYLVANDNAEMEEFLMNKACSIFSRQDVVSGNLDWLTEEPLQDPMLVFYDGCNPYEINPQVETCLNGLVEPSTNSSYPLPPNSFQEGTVPCGGAYVAENQALYDDRQEARAARDLKAYLDVYDALDDGADLTTHWTWRCSSRFPHTYVRPLDESNFLRKAIDDRIAELKSMAETVDISRSIATVGSNNEASVNKVDPGSRLLTGFRPTARQKAAAEKANRNFSTIKWIDVLSGSEIPQGWNRHSGKGRA